MSKRVYFVAHGGTVQGVGFRYFAQKKAQEYGVTGWCRNTSDDNVEGEAQADDSVLSKFLEAIDDGPRHATVAHLTKEDRDVVQGEANFDVRR